MSENKYVNQANNQCEFTFNVNAARTNFIAFLNIYFSK